MNLLVSDYDDTFNNSVVSVEENIEAIKSFISNGNIFTIATARDYRSIKGEINKYKIPYSYLITNNGATLFDNNDKILHFTLIGYNEFIKAYTYLKRLNFIKKIKILNMHATPTPSYNNTIEIECYIEDEHLDKIPQIQETINYLKCENVDNFLFVEPFTEKTDSIRLLAQKLYVNEKNIYTIGDNYNDEDMLRTFNGFIVPNAIEHLKYEFETIESVSSLVRRIERTK